MFTATNAKEMAARSIASRKNNGWKAKSKAYFIAPQAELLQDAAHNRLSRLWECIELIDKRVRHELNKERPDGTLLKDLATTARLLKDQAEAPANGHKRQPAVQAPELPEPTV